MEASVPKEEYRARTQSGAAVVEGIISFVCFLFVLFTILNVVNYCRAQALISNAVDSAAKEMSQYAYFYKMSGLQKLSEEVSVNSQNGAANLNDIIGTVDTLYKSVGTAANDSVEGYTNTMNAVSSGTVGLEDVQNTLQNLSNDMRDINTGMNSVMNAFSRVGNDPMLYMRSLAALAANDALDGAKTYLIAAPLARLFMAKHFGESMNDASEALKKLGVVDGLDGMNFNASTIFSSSAPDEVHIVVYYRLQLLQVFEFAEVKLSICKEARTTAWLGGDDVSVVVIEFASNNNEGGGDADEENDAGGEEENSEDTKNEPEQEDQADQKEQEEQNAQEDTGQQQSTPSTGIWAEPELDEFNYNDRAAGFRKHLVESKHITEEMELVVNGLIYGRDDNGVAYGMDYCATAEDAEFVVLSAYDLAFDALKGMEDAWVESGGESGFEPGSTTEYRYIVYVPENISDEEYDKICAKVREKADIYLDAAIAKTGLDIPASVVVERAGGNYDYSANGEG